MAHRSFIKKKLIFWRHLFLANYSNGYGVAKNWHMSKLTKKGPRRCHKVSWVQIWQIPMESVPNCWKEIAARHAIRWFKCKLKPPKNHMVSTWKPHGVHMETTWYLQRNHMVSTWKPCGVHVVTTLCPHWNHMMSIWKPCFVYIETMWFSHGNHMVSTFETLWWPPGNHMVCTWEVHGNHMVSTWKQCDVHVVTMLCSHRNHIMSM